MEGYSSGEDRQTRSYARKTFLKGERVISTIIIGGGGRAAIQKLSEKYHSMTAEQQAAAVALETQFVADVEALCADADAESQE